MTSATVPMSPMTRDGAARARQIWGWTLAAVTVVALGLRVAFVLGHIGSYPLAGDAWVYHHEAHFLAEGHGFISPWALSMQHQIRPTADHPPLFVVMLALGEFVGVGTVQAQLLVNAFLGSATVALIGLAGRRIGGDVVGLVAALIAALYPGLWSWNGQLLSETLATFLVAAAVLSAYRYIDRRSEINLFILSGVVALAGLARGELFLLLAVLVAPLVAGAFRSKRDPYRLGRNLAITVVVPVLVVGPWSIYNASRFKESAPISTGFGRALDSGACQGFVGDRIGFWDAECLNRNITPTEFMTLDESELDHRYRDDAIAVMRGNPGQVPIVLAARVGRTVHLYDVGRQLQFDQLTESREWWVSGAALTSWYLLAGLGIGGVAVLRRRGAKVLPLVAPLAASIFGVIIAFGTTRYRATAEPAVVLLAACGAVAAFDHLRSTKRRHSQGDLWVMLGSVAGVMVVTMLVGAATIRGLGMDLTSNLPPGPPPPELPGPR